MKKIFVLLAAAVLAVSAYAATPVAAASEAAAASVAPAAAIAPAATVAPSAAIASVDLVARTESMTKKLGLNDRQARKVLRLNMRYSDVLGEEIKIGKPIHGGPEGPYYDTPGRPHPSGQNGVPGSWSKNPNGAPDGAAMGVSSAEVAPADGAAVADGSDANSKEVEKLLKRRAEYEKKLARILTPEQFKDWLEGQKPFTGR